MARNKQSAIICIAVMSLCTVAHGKIIYVDDDANSPGNGSSWENAYRFLQDALADANDSLKPVEIHVAQGTYKPDQGAGNKLHSPEATFRLIKGVILRGGYAGLTETDPNVRDIRRYESILSGDLDDDDPDVNEPWDGIYRPGRNSVTVVTGSSTDVNAVLDGFTVRGGYYPVFVDKIDLNNPPQPMGSGGGMNNLRGSPTVIGCTFIANMSFGAGGGMCNQSASHPTVIDCAFIRNYASGRGGGAVANYSASHPTFTRCTFNENSTWDRGGAVYNHKSGPTFEGCTFARNSTTSKSGGYGGAIYNEDSTCTSTACVFTENNTSSFGGAVCSLDNSRLSLERCIFSSNLAGTGGAITDQGKNNDSTVNGCTFRQNAARGSGGAMSLWGPAHVSDCVFNGNHARTSGGAAAVRTATFTNCLFAGNRTFEHPRMEQGVIVRGEGGSGGAVFTGGSIEPLYFINCTFAENYARFGSAVMTDKFTEFRNCIMRGPRLPIWADPYEPQPQVTYCNVEGTWPGEGSIDVDPLFAKPGHWANRDDPNSPGDPNDPNVVWVDGDYHLKSQAGRWDPNEQRWVADDVSSLCIDAGDPNSPLGDEPEPNGGRINMGAYGGTAEASMSHPPQTFDERNGVHSTPCRLSPRP